MNGVGEEKKSEGEKRVWERATPDGVEEKKKSGVRERATQKSVGERQKMRR